MLGSESPCVFIPPLCSETAEKEAAARRYEKLQAEGKTDQAIKDLARLEIIRKQREESKKKREAEEAAAAAAGCILYSVISFLFTLVLSPTISQEMMNEDMRVAGFFYCPSSARLYATHHATLQ